MHQPVDQRCGQSVVHIEQGAPFPERSIRAQDDRAGFITGGNYLEQQVGPALVDGQIAQLIEEEKTGADVSAQRGAQPPLDLGHRELIDHVYHARIEDGVATLSRAVAERCEKVRLSRSGRSNQHGTAVLGNEVAVKEPEDGSLGNALREVEVVLGERLRLGEPRQPQPTLEGTLLTGSLLHADQRRQHLQHRVPFASRLVEYLAVALGDLQELQLGQVAVQPRLEIVIASRHEGPRWSLCRSDRKRPDRQVPNRSRRSVRGGGAWAEWAWGVVAVGVRPARGSRHRPRHRPPVPTRV